MIRIDELYDNTFWPWMQEHIPGTRMFYCDPPGHTGIDCLFNHGDINRIEFEYIFMHDQEPVDTEMYQSLFDEVKQRNNDLHNGVVENPDKNTVMGKTTKKHWVTLCKKTNGSVVVSEKGKFVDDLYEKYGWRSYYYFWHGWASLDWYRGYHRTFLIDRAAERKPSKTFLSPNRIIGGHRDHRVLFLYHVFKNNLQHNHISAPRTCPEEHTDITHIAYKYTNRYPDITSVLATDELPVMFAREDTQKMSSCWLDNFNLAADSMFYVPTETVYWGKRLHLTEKTFKPIALEMPFILVAPAHSLEYLRSYGFKTFGNVIDESYDDEEDDFTRLEKIAKLLTNIEGLSAKEKQQIYQHCIPAATYNYNHFYYGSFEQILWQELKVMLAQIKQDYV